MDIGWCKKGNIWEQLRTEISELKYIDSATGRLRILTPVEAERIQGFDDEWTKISLIDGKETQMPDRLRRFCMGNALVVPMITLMGKVLDSIIESE